MLHRGRQHRTYTEHGTQLDAQMSIPLNPKNLKTLTLNPNPMQPHTTLSKECMPGERRKPLHAAAGPEGSYSITQVCRQHIEASQFTFKCYV